MEVGTMLRIYQLCVLRHVQVQQPIQLAHGDKIQPAHVYRLVCCLMALNLVLNGILLESVLIFAQPRLVLMVVILTKVCATLCV